MKQTKAQLQEANENLNKIIRQQGKQLNELRENYDLAARRLDSLLAKDFSLTKEVEKIKSLADIFAKQKSRGCHLSWIDFFFGAAVSAHIVYIFVLIAFN